MGGQKMTQAQVAQVVTHLEQCNAKGTGRLPMWDKNAPQDVYSHYFVSLESVHVKEQRFDPQTGRYEPRAAELDLTDDCPPVTSCTVKLGDEEISVPTSGPLHFVYPKGKLLLPAEAFLTLAYTSPVSGAWFAEDIAFTIEHVEVSGKCCVMM